jgi:hypothetical protein
VKEKGHPKLLGNVTFQIKNKIKSLLVYILNVEGLSHSFLA